MAEKTVKALPLVPQQYDPVNESINRRTIEQAIQDVNSEIGHVKDMQESGISKAVKRHIFLLMGASHCCFNGGSISMMLTALSGIKLPDNEKIFFGDGNDLEIFHDSSDSYIQNATGNIEIRNNTNDGDINFRSDNGSGGLTTYFAIDGGGVYNRFYKNAYFTDDVKALFGNSSDLEIYHDGSNSYIKDVGTGNLRLRGTDLRLESSSLAHNFIVCTEGGSVTAYHNDSSKFSTTATGINVTGTIVGDGLDLYDNEKIRLGASQDLEIYHSGSDSWIHDNGTGNLNIKSNGTFINFLDGSNNLMAYMVPGGAVGLYHNTSAKLATTATGIDVTGQTVTDGITLTGTGTDNDSHQINFVNGACSIARDNNDLELHAFNAMVFGVSNTSYPTSVERMRIDSSGNLCIGNTSAAAKLDIRQDSGTAIRCEDGSGGYFIVKQGGSVGISTTSPKAKLHVANSDTPTFNTDTHAGESIFVRAGGGTSSGDAQGVIGFGKADGTSDRTGAAIASVQTDSDVDKVGLGFYTSGSSASTQTMTQKVLINHLGNVGIGISSGMTYPLTIHDNNSSNSYVHFVNSTTGTAFGDGSQIGVPSGGTDLLILNRESSNIRMFTGGSERLRIDSAGRLLMGGTSTSFNDILRVFGDGYAGAWRTGTNATYVGKMHNNAGKLALETDGSRDIQFGNSTNTQVMYIDTSAQNIGIGTVSPSRKLTVQGGSGDNLPVRIIGGATTTSSTMEFQDPTTTANFKVTLGSKGDNLFFQAGGTERMRIDSSGNVLFSKTVADNTALGTVIYNDNGISVVRSAGTTAVFNRLTSDGDILTFRKDSTTAGTISVTGSSTAYNTSSDARLKEVTGEADGLDIINNLNPVDFKWVKTGVRDQGLLAQEVKKLVPNAVSETEEGYYQMDYSKLVTPLIKAVQEQQEQIESLKSEINKLKGK